MGPEQDQYILYGGKAGYDRLLVLSRERWPDTEALFQRAGLRPGLRCFDLGCGGGEVTLQIAARVKPGGSVTGLDMDSEKIALAREEAKRRGLENAEFRTGTVADWEEKGAYDFVYSRFVLQHLRNPGQVLAKLWAAVRAPGVLVVEDADHASWAIYPPDSGFEFFHRMMLTAQRRAGGDPEAGRKLFAYARLAGIPNPEVELRSTLRIDGEGKMLPLLNLEAVGATLIAQGLATDTEVAGARDQLARALADPNSLVIGPRIFQLVCRKT